MLGIKMENELTKTAKAIENCHGKHDWALKLWAEQQVREIAWGKK
jgi:hypothetical protein